MLKSSLVVIDIFQLNMTEKLVLFDYIRSNQDNRILLDKLLQFDFFVLLSQFSQKLGFER